MRELGIEKVEDPGALDAAISRALAAHAGEAERYRAGEKKLFGVLVGAVLREIQGAADPARVRSLLQERLG
jgi:glutaminyl-tRNA synthetase